MIAVLMLPAVPERDRPKLAAIYARYWTMLFRVAMVLLRRAEDAEDAAHRVFVQLAKNRDKLDGYATVDMGDYYTLEVEATINGRT